jgi:hypothetical protein
MSCHSGESQDREHGLHPFLLLPPPCRLGHHDGERVVVERIVEKSSSNIVYPTLTHTNYIEWLLVMKVNLQAAGL